MIASQLIGQEIDGYQILEVIGRGGMGVVLKAEDVSLGRLVAIKLIDPTYATDETFLRRFRREAKALARLRSPHIVTVHALRPTEVGLFIVMEHVDGSTLKEHYGSGPVPWRQLLPVLRQVLGALDHAHSLDVVHRDIKPGNIMLTSAGQVKVMDFGIAKILSSDPGATTTQGAIGTPYYMSPEQLAGEQSIDGRSDLYSLAMTAYRLLTGRLPFEADSNLLNIYRAIAEEELPSPRSFNADIPLAVADIIDKGLCKAPADRFQTASEMLAALSEAEVKPETSPALASTRSDITSTVVTSPLPRARFSDRASKPVRNETHRRRWFLLGAIALLICFLGFGWAWAELQGSNNTSPPSNPKPTEMTLVTPAPDSIFLPDSTEVNTGAPPVDSEDVAAPETENEVQQAAQQGTLVVRSDPDGAEIIINGRNRGSTPARLTLPSGSYRVRVEHDGYEPTETTLRLADGGTTERTLSLTALVGSVEISVQPYGDVYIDGVLRQRNVTFVRTFELPAGNHTLQVQHPEFGTWERQVTILPDGIERVGVNLLREIPLIVTAFDTNGQPVSGEIFIDDISTGKRTPSSVSVRVGQRRIEARAEGYISGGQTINLNAQGRNTPLRLTLEKTGN